jgi:UPF0042 nucleotide-binding protein
MTPTAAARPGRTPFGGVRFVVLTGLSGAGKSQALRALEDLGYFCVDNLPMPLIPTLATLSRKKGAEMPRVAVLVDVREGVFLEAFTRVYRQLRAMPGLNPIIVFLEASDPALVRRFSETRRPHPVAPDRSALEGIAEERVRLSPIRRLADHVLDTSDMTVHELRRMVMDLSRGAVAGSGLVITMLSFGFKHGLPLDADLVLDVRFMPNPHFVPRLRRKTGQDRHVRQYIWKAGATREFMDRALGLLRFLVPHYVEEGKSYLTVAVGCTGGRHRSVAVAEELGKAMNALEDVRVRVRHRDIGLT